MHTMTRRLGATVVTAVVCALLSGCSSMKTTTDWDRETDFSRYRTFAILDENPINNPEIHNAFVRVIEVAMQEKGFTPATSDPDLMVSVYGRADATVRLDMWTYAYDPWWGPYAAIAPRNVDVGTVVLDIADARRKQLVYRAIATDALPERPRGDGSLIFKAVDSLLADFPPR